MKKNILMVCVAVILSLGIGFVIPNMLGSRVEGLQIDKELQKKNAAKQFNEEMQRIMEAQQEQMVMEELRNQVAVARERLAQLSVETAQKIDAEFQRQASIIYDEGNSIDKARATVQAQLAASGQSALDSTPAAVTNNSSLDAKIAAHRGEISEADIEAGKRLYGAVDTQYIYGMMEGGLTPEEDAAVQNYLHSIFSGSEYDRAKELYYRYAHLMAD